MKAGRIALGLVGALALGLFVYLGYALLRPENF